MIKSNLNHVQANRFQAAIAFELGRTGHSPKSVTVVMGDHTLMITLYGALSPAEIALAGKPAERRHGPRVSLPACLSAPNIRCGKKSNELLESRCAKPSRKAKRQSPY